MKKYKVELECKVDKYGDVCIRIGDNLKWFTGVAEYVKKHGTEIKESVMKIIAILDKSAGNDSVGEMWKETKSFDANEPIIEILNWATLQRSSLPPYGMVSNPESMRSNLTITVDQASIQTEEKNT